MDAAPVLLASDPLAVLRVFNRLRRAGVRLSVDGGRLAVESGSPLSDTQRAFLHAHKHELVGLLEDAATLAAVLADAGADGGCGVIRWRGYQRRRCGRIAWRATAVRFAAFLRCAQRHGIPD